MTIFFVQIFFIKSLQIAAIIRNTKKKRYATEHRVLVRGRNHAIQVIAQLD